MSTGLCWFCEVGGDVYVPGHFCEVSAPWFLLAYRTAQVMYTAEQSAESDNVEEWVRAECWTAMDTKGIPEAIYDVAALHVERSESSPEHQMLVHMAQSELQKLMTERLI